MVCAALPVWLQSSVHRSGHRGLCWCRSGLQLTQGSCWEAASPLGGVSIAWSPAPNDTHTQGQPEAGGPWGACGPYRMDVSPAWLWLLDL